MNEAVRDVFISYSHKDNLSLSEDRLGWVDRFYRAFSVRLTQLLGRDTKMFFDRSVMSGSNVLTPKIRAEIAEAKILVSIISPGYLRSDWCNEELGQFAATLASDQPAARIPTISRIVKVIKLPVDPSMEKQAKVDLSDVLGYRFYQIDQRGIASEFDLDDEPQNRREFVKRVNELAYDVRKILDTLEGDASSPAPIVEPSGKVVYVAEPSYDLRGEAEQLRSELTQYGHSVVPARELSHGPAYAGSVASALAGADVAIHIVGTRYAAIPEGERNSSDEIQYDLATKEMRKRPSLKRLVWSPPNAEVDDERQQAFLARLDEAAERIVAPFDTLRSLSHTLLEPPPVAAQVPEAPAAAPTGAAAQRSIYLIYDLSDREAVQALDDALFAAGFDVLSPAFDGDESEIRKHDERCIAACDAVLIFAQNAPSHWLTQRAIDLQKAPAFGRERPFLAQGIALGPPRTPDKDRIRRQAFVKLELYGGATAEALEPFLSAIERARTGP